MRIGISTSVIQRGRTGIAQYLFALLRSCREVAHEHEFVLFVLEQDLPLFDFVSDNMELVTVPETFRPPMKDILWHQLKLPRLARKHRLDVLHVPSYRRMLGTKPCAIVATIHDLAPFHLPDKYDWKRMFYGRVIARRLARQQNEIIAISNNTAHDVEHFFGISPERISVVHNGLEHERFHQGSSANAKALVAERHRLQDPFFLYVARLEHPAKNHVRLIAAFNRFKALTGSDWRLALGGSDWHGSEVIHAAIRNSPYASHIHLLGFVPDETLPDLYRAADAFVYPSLYEGFGMPPTEAMACGCPVICSARGSLGEIVGDAAAVVDPEDIQSIASQLILLAGDPAQRSRLRSAGLAQAKKFDWRKTAVETLQVYHRAALSMNSDPTRKQSRPWLNGRDFDPAQKTPVAR